MKRVISYQDFKIPVNEGQVKKPDTKYVMLMEDYNSNLTLLKNAITGKFVCTIYYKGERRVLS